MRDILIFNNKSDWLDQRLSDITSSDVASLFGLGRDSYYKLFQIKKHHIVIDEDNEYMRIGRAIEPFIAQIACERIEQDLGCKIKKKEEYIRIPELRAGSSFDYVSKNYQDEFLVEIKNVDGFIFSRDWKKNEIGELIPPYQIELQVQHQMLVSGINTCYIAALVGGNRFELIKRGANEAIQQHITDRVNQFWKDIENMEDVSPDFSNKKDIEFFEKYIEKKEPKILVAKQPVVDMIESYKQYRDSKRHIEEELDKLKTQISLETGDADTIVDGTGKKMCSFVTVPGSKGKLITQEMVGIYINEKREYKRFSLY
jgi:predicted phage-related endonuclease